MIFTFGENIESIRRKRKIEIYKEEEKKNMKKIAKEEKALMKCLRCKFMLILIHLFNRVLE